MKGRYSDGRSAASYDVDATVQGGSLVIAGAGGRTVWPLASLRRIDAGDPDRLVVEPRGGDGERISFAMSDCGALVGAAPRLMHGTGGGTAALAAGLIAAAAVIVGFVFFGLPAMSGPLARAVPPATEVGLGARSRQTLDLFMDDCAVDEAAQATLDDLARRFEEASGAPFELKVELVEASFPNAFALPGGQILVTDDLLRIMERPEELAGVLAHETAHVARRHVMAAVLREIGYGFVLDLVLGGGSGAGQQIALAGASIDSLRHSRRAEAEADALALEYLEALDIDGTGLAQFFERLNEYFAEQDDPLIELDFPELLSTHPDTLRRAKQARDEAGASRSAAMSAAEWAHLQAACGPNDEEIEDEPSKPGEDGPATDDPPAKAVPV